MIAAGEMTNITNYILGRIARGKYTIGGVTKDVNLYSTNIVGNTITVKLYLAESDAGTITNVKLISIGGGTFADKPDSIQKVATKGVLITFTFIISEV